MDNNLQKENPERLKELWKKASNKYREKNKNSELVKLKNKIYCKNYREKIKKEKKLNNNNSQGFKNRELMLRKVRKIEPLLPESQEKKNEIIEELSHRHFKPSNKVDISQPKAIKEVDILIKEFYVKDSVSVCLPGKRDFVTVNNNDGTKEKVRKRVLVETKNETFKKFQKENPNVKVSRSKFCSLTPENVKSFKEMPQYSCLCKQHANWDFMFKAIKSSLTNCDIETKYELLSIFTCSLEHYDCMAGNCENCCNIEESITNFIQLDIEDEIKAEQWCNTNIFIPETVKWTYHQWLQYFKKQVEQFKIHFYVTNIQSISFDLCVKDIPDNLCVILMDFSENASTKVQNEIQSAHFNRTMITIFTGVIYFPIGFHLSFAIISNCLKHDKLMVYACKKELLNIIKKHQPQTDEIVWFSDGAPSHFKNCYSLSNLLLLERETAMKHSWNFFSPGHGKGAADGIGGNVKNMVNTRTISQDLRVNSSLDYFNTLKKANSSIFFIHIDKSEVLKNEKKLNDHWKNVVSIKNLRQYFLFETSGSKHLRCFATSNRHDEYMCKVLK